MWLNSGLVTTQQQQGFLEYLEVHSDVVFYFFLSLCKSLLVFRCGAVKYQIDFLGKDIFRTVDVLFAFFGLCLVLLEIKMNPF
jgi:hypothetical protein